MYAACNETLPLGHANLPEFDSAISALDVEWFAAGYYDPSLSRLLSLLSFTAALFLLSLKFSSRRPFWGGLCMGLAILSLFRHAHECGHEKGYHNPKLYPSERVHRYAMYAIANLGVGIDGLVWQKQHRLHHAYTLTDRDPQISARPGAVMPLFSQHEGPLRNFIANHPLGSVLVRWQEFTYLPLLTIVGKYFLGVISYQLITREGYPQQDEFIRKTTLLGHYVMLLLGAILLVWRPTSKKGERSSVPWRIRGCALWLLGCSTAAGLIEPMFLFNHVQTGPSKHLEASDKVAQLCHTINYELRMPRFLPVDEYLIAVSYHIEHHLAPKMPDENLRLITEDVKRVARQFGVPYRSRNMEDMVWEYTQQLAAVPRDRWGGTGCLLPLLLAAAIFVLPFGGSIRLRALRQRARTKLLRPMQQVTPAHLHMN